MNSKNLSSVVQGTHLREASVFRWNEFNLGGFFGISGNVWEWICGSDDEWYTESSSYLERKSTITSEQITEFHEWNTATLSHLREKIPRETEILLLRSVIE